MIIQKSNKVLLIAILMLSLFALTTNKSEAQCPAGYSFTNINITIYGCQYSVPVCYKCAPTALDATLISFPNDTNYAITKVDTSCTPYPVPTREEIIAYAMIEARNRIFLSSLCEIRPCNEPPFVLVKQLQYSCWYKDSNNNLRPCLNEAVCEVVYRACKNNNTIIWTKVSANYFNNIEPDCEVISNPADYECFRVGTDCD